MTGRYAALSARLDYAFSDCDLLGRALTHRSKGSANYERLEFLGDSVLGLVIADVLYRRFPGLSEGELTRVRAGLVRREALARLARNIKIGDHLQLGEGELKSGGFEKVRYVIERLYQAPLASIDPAAILKDPKTRLQEFLQKQSLGVPIYNMLEITGDPHQQHFVVECLAAGLEQPVRGEGGSRRIAEQEAAARAYAILTAQTGNDYS